MSSLTAIFGSSAEKAQDSDKLMDLYWNRAELKKEFAGMRKEQFRLQERVKKEEGATARLRQRLDHLEDLLADPGLAHNVVVYYQLRGLGRQCERKLAKFGEQLKQQREQKRHDSLMVDWAGNLREESKVVGLELLEKRDTLLHLEDRLQSEQCRLTSMSGLTRLFRGRSAMKLIDEIADQIEWTTEEERLIVASLSEIKDRQPPDNEGLDLSAKRSINLMILAFAQQVYIHFLDAGIAPLLKEAMEKSVGAISYGTRHECGQLLDRIARSTDSMEQVSGFVDVLQKRARMLGDTAKFSSDEDAVPLAATVATVFRIDENGAVSEIDANLSSDNYWGISKVYSR